jgi:hypothetical protein
MADTIHKKILDQLKANVQLAKVVNGYVTNIGNNVYHQSPAPLTDLELPACNILDRTTQFDPGSYQHACRMEVDIEIYAAGDNALSDVYAAIGDIIKAIGTDRQLGGNATNIRLNEYTTQTEYTDQTIASSVLNFTIEFFINLFDPQNQ